MKLAVPCVDFTQQVKALRYFNGHGMARMLGEGMRRMGAMLLERLRPGKTLAEEVRDDDEATRIIARVLQAMWVPVADNPGFKTFADWGRNFQADTKEVRGQGLPAVLARRGLDGGDAAGIAGNLGRAGAAAW